MDRGKVCDVHAVQINFADDRILMSVPGKIHEDAMPARYIEEAAQQTRWILEGSADGEQYAVLEDKSRTDTSLSHDPQIRIWRLK